MAASHMRSGVSRRRAIISLRRGGDRARAPAGACVEIARSITFATRSGPPPSVAHRPVVGALVSAPTRRVELRVGIRRRATLRVGHARRRRLAELGHDQARLEQDHVDAEAAQLEAQRVGDRLERVLGRVVDARRPGNDRRPPIEPTLTILPQRCARISAAPAGSGARARTRSSRTGGAPSRAEPSRSRRSGCSRRC